MKRPRILFALALAGAVTGGAVAHPVAPKEAQADSASDATIDRAELARDVIQYARDKRDVRLMIVAARMLRDGDFVLALADNAPLVIGRARKGEEFPVTTPDALLGEARGWAQGDQDLLEAVETVQAQAARGIIPTAIVYTHDLPADRALTMRARAEGGRLALVRVRGDGDAALELAVVDSAGRTACVDRPAADSARARGDLSCKWTPNRTEEYRIVLRNKGRVWTRAILVSN